MLSAPILCALSGGVDSATAAALLVEQGRNVVGMTMRLYNASGTTASLGGRCCGPRDIEDARAVSAHLGIPYYVVDFEASFTKHVVDDFTSSYLAGETPNPCVKCNQYIKFTPLLARARALGIEVMATGHYARLEPEGGRTRLLRGADLGKDQSYFLFSMPQDELAAIRFPLGALTKEEVRAEAERFGLPNADKADSQEICFVPDGDYGGFVERVAQTQGITIPVAGPIVDASGAEVGRHRGLHRYTVGQRRGLGDLKLKTGDPVYVAQIDIAKNTLHVGARDQAGSSHVVVRDARWFGATPVDGEAFESTVQLRHRAKAAPVRVTRKGDRMHLEFEGDAPIAAPGQAAVLYQDDVVVGGGWVAR